MVFQSEAGYRPPQERVNPAKVSFLRPKVRFLRRGSPERKVRPEVYNSHRGSSPVSHLPPVKVSSLRSQK
jgi:hypothetical protein